MDHIRQKHSVKSPGNSVKAANLARWFPPWTVTRAVWRKAMKSHVSGMSTDVLLFSERCASLVHHYRVFARNAAHTSLRGKFMAGLRSFIEHAEAEVTWEFNRLPCRRNQLPPTSDTLRSIGLRDLYDGSPLCKTRRVVSPVAPEVSADNQPSMSGSSVKSSASPAVSYVSPAPRACSLLYVGWLSVVPVSLELPRFADKDFVQSRIQSVVVATQPYPASPELRASTVCVDLDAFPSEGSGSSDSFISISPDEEDRVSISPVNSGDGEPTDMVMEVSQIQPLNPPQSPVTSHSQLWWNRHRAMKCRPCP